jgi:hypothetical protein
MEGQIYGAIIDAMGQITAIGKDRKNQTQGFQYRGIDDVMNEMHGIMAKCGIFVVPTVLEEQRTIGSTSRGGNMFYTRLKIKFTFFAKDGSSVEAVVIGEAMDTGDKASNKALSIGLKYAMLQVFCIPTEEDKDPDAVSPTFIPPAEKSDNRKKLADIVSRYEKQLGGDAYTMCTKALAGNDENEIADKLQRAINYLARCGVNV